MSATPMIELWRGGLLESSHTGHAVIFGPDGVEQAWGDPDAVIFPRSSCKMLQALPLLESGAADDAGLTTEHLALACASHNGDPVHTERVDRWLSGLEMGEDDLRCGSHLPMGTASRDAMIRADQTPCQLHNNCSGKHAGFLTLNRRLKGGTEYVEVDHPVQRAVKAAFEEVVQETSPGHGIDGCSAPNFACTVTGLARSMAFFAGSDPDGDARNRAAARLWRAMAAHPELVAGEGRACTDLMRATGGRAVVKTGAEAVFIGILPETRRGIAVKITDGGTRAAEAAITALLIREGILDAAHPAAAKYLSAPQKNWRGFVTGEMRLAPGFG
ncbi:MAG: asparaginase [Paracoccaceae bacterium]